MSEPVAWMDEKEILWNSVSNPENYTALYTAPPKREWVDLTDEEINALIQKWAGELVFEVTQALKEKNT